LILILILIVIVIVILITPVTTRVPKSNLTPLASVSYELRRLPARLSGRPKLEL
jgi:hypothetical protein